MATNDSVIDHQIWTVYVATNDINRYLIRENFFHERIEPKEVKEPLLKTFDQFTRWAEWRISIQ